MNAEQDLDLVLSAWVRAANPGPAPAPSVGAALAEIERTPQRQRLIIGPLALPMPVTASRRPTAGQAVLLVAALVVSLVAMTAGIGAISRLLPGPTPSATPVPPSAAPTPVAVGDRRYRFRDEGVHVTVPATWSRIGGEGGLILFVAADGTTASIYHGDPRRLAVCDPRCETVDLPFRLPFDAQRVRADAVDRIGEQAASKFGDTGIRWEPARGLSSRLIDPQRLQVSEPEAQHAYLVASYITNLVVIAVSTPGSERAAGYLDHMLESLVLFPANLPAVGTPVARGLSDHGADVMIPDTWPADSTAPAPSVASFGNRSVTISFANADGSIAICDPTCRMLTAPDLATLEAATFAAPSGAARSGDLTLSSYPGRFQVVAGTAPSYRAIGFVDGWAVHIWVALPPGEVDRSVAEAIVASFTFVPTWTRVVDGVLVGNGFELPLAPEWDGFAISVSSGDRFHRYRLCTVSTWSSARVPCTVQVAQTLDEMALQIGYGPAQTDAILDGEPAVVVRVESGEYPAKGPQWAAFVMAVHNGQPFFIRIQSGTSPGLPVDEVIAAFRFTD